MRPIAIASLAAITGLFVLLDRRAGDQRVALAGLRNGVLLTALGILAILVLAATTVSLTATTLFHEATQWPTYAAANILLGFTCGLNGALLVPLFGRVGGVFLALLLPFMDLGIVQSPMLHPETHHALPTATRATEDPESSSTGRSPAESTRPAHC